MGTRIDQFCEDFRQKLTMTASGLDGLKDKIAGKAANVDQDVRSHLDRVNKRIGQGRAKVTAAQAEIKNWTEDKKIATEQKVAEWKTKRQSGQLQNRADRAERYAAAASDVAIAAIDEAEKASLEACLARVDADSTQAR
jgi:hypothetical protein